MDLTMTIFNQTIIMMILIIGGMLCYKFKMISASGSKEISKLILHVVNPVMIFLAYQREFDVALLKGLLTSFGLSALAFAVVIIMSQLCIRQKGKDPKTADNLAIERFSSIYSNCAFMGMPLINALFGYEGVFYLTAFLTIFNLLVWTHGLILISGVRSFKSVTKALRSPSVIMIFLGLIFFVAQISLPDVIYNTLDYISGLNTPLAMLVAGVTIAQTDLKKAFKNLRIYWVAFVRLLLIPTILILLFMLFPNVEQSVRLTVIIAMSAPSATMCTLFCITYDKNSLYASEIFAVTTLLSSITLPLLMLINTLIY